ncbi:MAG: hypothetical protein V4671_17920 [Armatimonadota bacterium]
MAFFRRLTTDTTCPAAIATTLVVLLFSGTASAQQSTGTQPPPVETPPSPPATLAPPPSNEPEARPKRLRFGPQVGVYIPTDARTRDRFGTSWSNVGFGIGNISDIHRNRRLALDISFISNSRGSRGDSKVFLAPIGLAYSIGLGNQARSTAAYTGISANLVIASLRSDSDNLPSRTSVTGGASVFLGNRFSDTGYIEARYNAVGKIRGFDLSGINLTAGLRF